LGVVAARGRAFQPIIEATPAAAFSGALSAARFIAFVIRIISISCGPYGSDPQAVEHRHGVRQARLSAAVDEFEERQHAGIYPPAP
jgi:hypothetical protein